jgi:hypothetical protein
MVEVQSYIPKDAEEEAWGLIAGGGMRKFDKFADESPAGSGQYVDRPVGTTYTGIVAANPKSYHAQDYDTKEPKFYASGQPILEVEIVLDTAERLDEDDDGKRRLRLGQIGKAALKEEMERLNIKKFGVGTQLTITFTGYRPNKSGRASKLVNITLVPAEYVPQQAQQVQQALAGDVAAPLTQAGYVEQAVAAGFPVGQPAASVQPAAAPVAAVVPAQQAAAPVAAPTGPMFSPEEIQQGVTTAQLLVANSIPRLQAVSGAAASVLRNLGRPETGPQADTFAQLIDTMLPA